MGICLSSNDFLVFLADKQEVQIPLNKILRAKYGCMVNLKYM